MTNVAVVGAGLAGLVVARLLRDNKTTVTVFEKSRGVGGRMATRYAGPYQFDHGAQFFTARNESFKQFLAPMITAGVVDVWCPRFAELEYDRVVAGRRWDKQYHHYVGAPRMNAIGKWLADGLDVRLQTPVARIERREGRDWTLCDENNTELGRFHWVIVTAPAEQTQALLPADVDLDWISNLAQGMQACFSLMLGFEAPPSLPCWQAALVRDADISWLSVNSSKPGRPAPFTLLAHSTNGWADEHLEDPVEAVREHLLAEASRVLRLDVSGADFKTVHRWRYANAPRQTGSSHWLDPALRLASCGDWFIRGRVEAAFTSAHDLWQALRPLLGRSG